MTNKLDFMCAVLISHNRQWLEAVSATCSPCTCNSATWYGEKNRYIFLWEEAYQEEFCRNKISFQSTLHVGESKILSLHCAGKWRNWRDFWADRCTTLLSKCKNVKRVQSHESNHLSAQNELTDWHGSNLQNIRQDFLFVFLLEPPEHCVVKTRKFASTESSAGNWLIVLAVSKLFLTVQHKSWRHFRSFGSTTTVDPVSATDSTND